MLHCQYCLVKTNVIRYNLNVMYIKKNVFDNIFNMVMEMIEKTKDTNRSSFVLWLS